MVCRSTAVSLPWGWACGLPEDAMPLFPHLDLGVVLRVPFLPAAANRPEASSRQLSSRGQPDTEMMKRRRRRRRRRR